MTKGDGLSWRQHRFVAAMATSRTIEEAARQVGVTKRTGLRYLADSNVKRELAGLLDTIMAEAARRASLGMADALETLETIHLDEEAPPGVRVSAARAILDAGPRLREAGELASLAAEIEDLLAREKL